MAASVASPIERQFSTIAGISSMTSTSALGTTTITIQFDLNRDIDGAALDVQTALSVAAAPAADRDDDAAVLPQGQSRRLPGPVHQPELADAADVDGRRIRRRPCWRSRFRSFPASRRCWSTARRNSPCASRSIRSPPRRATSRSTTSAPSLAKTNSNTPVGTLTGDRAERHAARRPARCSKAADYRKVVVAYRNGAPVKLDEIAQRHRQRRERQGRELVQRRPRGRAGDPAPARRQHRRGRRFGQGRSCRSSARRFRPSISMEMLIDRSISIRESVLRRAGNAADRVRRSSSW